MIGRLLSWLPVRPRTAIAIGLLLLVAIIVAIGRIIGGTSGPTIPRGQAPVSTVDPSTGDDSVVELELSPSPQRPSNGPDVVAAATTFAENWIDYHRPAQEWLDSLLPLCTDALATELSGVDPSSVPGTRITGPPVTEVHADVSVDVVFPIDAGKLRLSLVLTDGRWLVDGIDWERA